MTELFKEPSLFVIHNGAPVYIALDKIFDSENYTKFYGVSYVSSPKFFDETLRDFKEVNFILGFFQETIITDLEINIFDLNFSKRRRDYVYRHYSCGGEGF